MNLSALQKMPYDIIGVILSYTFDAEYVSSYFHIVHKYCKKNRNNGFILWFYIMYMENKRNHVSNRKINFYDVFMDTNSDKSVLQHFNGKDYVDVFGNETYFIDMTCKLIFDGILTLNENVMYFYHDYVKKHNMLRKNVNYYLVTNMQMKENMYGLLILEKYDLCDVKEKDYCHLLSSYITLTDNGKYFLTKKCQRIVYTKINTSIPILHELILLSRLRNDEEEKDYKDYEELFEALEFLARLKKIDFATEICLLLSAKFNDEDKLYTRLLCFFVENIERNYNSRHFVISQLNKKNTSYSSIFVELEKQEFYDPRYYVHDIRVFMDYICGGDFYDFSGPNPYDSFHDYFEIKTNIEENSSQKVIWSEYYYSTGEMLCTAKDVLSIPKKFWKQKKISKKCQREMEYDSEDIKYKFLSKNEKNEQNRYKNKTNESSRIIGPLEEFNNYYVTYNSSYDQYDDYTTISACDSDPDPYYSDSDSDYYDRYDDDERYDNRYNDYIDSDDDYDDRYNRRHYYSD